MYLRAMLFAPGTKETVMAVPCGFRYHRLGRFRTHSFKRRNSKRRMTSTRKTKYFYSHQQLGQPMEKAGAFGHQRYHASQQLYQVSPVMPAHWELVPLLETGKRRFKRGRDCKGGKRFASCLRRGRFYFRYWRRPSQNRERTPIRRLALRKQIYLFD